MERLSELSGSGSRGGRKAVDDMGRVEDDGFENDFAGHSSDGGRFAPKWDEFRLNGEEPEVLKIKGEDVSVKCDANHMLPRLDEMSIDNVSSRPGDTHSLEVCSFDIAFQHTVKISLILFLLDV